MGLWDRGGCCEHHAPWGTTKVGEIAKKVRERRLRWVWSCDAKRVTLRRKEGNGNESAGEKEERKI